MQKKEIIFVVISFPIMAHGKGKGNKIRHAAQQNKKSAVIAVTETVKSESTIIVGTLPPPVVPASSEKSPNWFQQNPILTNIIVAIGAIVATELYHYAMSGPRIDLKVYDYFQHFERRRPGIKNTYVIMIPATIKNTGDKKYFLDIAKFELKINGEWKELERTEVEDLDDVQFARNDSINFVYRPNINSNVSVGGDDELPGRFIFITASDSLNVVDRRNHQCRFTLIDENENKLVFERDLDKVDSHNVDDYYNNTGIKRKPIKIH